jgi:hypothetical protein
MALIYVPRNVQDAAQQLNNIDLQTIIMQLSTQVDQLQEQVSILQTPIPTGGK